MNGEDLTAEEDEEELGTGPVRKGDGRERERKGVKEGGMDGRGWG